MRTLRNRTSCFSKTPNWFVNFSGGTPLLGSYCSQNCPRYRQHSWHNLRAASFSLRRLVLQLRGKAPSSWFMIASCLSHTCSSQYLECLSLTLENSLFTFEAQLKCYLCHKVFFCAPRQLVMSLSRLSEHSFQISFLRIYFVVFELFVYIYMFSPKRCEPPKTGSISFIFVSPVFSSVPSLSVSAYQMVEWVNSVAWNSKELHGHGSDTRYYCINYLNSHEDRVIYTFFIKMKNSFVLWLPK